MKGLAPVSKHSRVTQLILIVEGKGRTPQMLLPRSRRLGETDIGMYVLSTAKVRIIFQREKSKLPGFVLQTQYIAYN